MLKIRWENDLETEYCYWQAQLKIAKELKLNEDIELIREALKNLAEQFSV